MYLNPTNAYTPNFKGVLKVSNAPVHTAKDIQNAVNGGDSCYFSKEQVENLKNLLKVKLKDYDPNKGIVVANSYNSVYVFTGDEAKKVLKFEKQYTDGISNLAGTPFVAHVKESALSQAKSALEGQVRTVAADYFYNLNKPEAIQI